MQTTFEDLAWNVNAMIECLQLYFKQEDQSVRMNEQGQVMAHSEYDDRNSKGS